MTNLNHWHIVGHGAIGLLWAQKLNQYHNTSLIMRQSSTDNTPHCHFTYTSLNGKQSDLTLTKTRLTTSNKIDHLLVPVKAYDVIPAIAQLKSYLTDNCTIVLCHNGMGTITPVQQQLTNDQSLYFATTTHAAYKPSPTQIIHTGAGETKIGLIQGENRLKTQKGLLAPIQWQDNIETTLWTKLAINCAINPLTAIHNCRNGELAQAKYQHIITSICEEFVLVANQCGQSFEVEQLISQCQQVINATANNYSSMHQDIHHGRASEIDYITGFIIQKATQLKLSVPTHELIYRKFTHVATDNQ